MEREGLRKNSASSHPLFQLDPGFCDVTERWDVQSCPGLGSSVKARSMGDLAAPSSRPWEGSDAPLGTDVVRGVVPMKAGSVSVSHNPYDFPFFLLPS